MKHLVHHGANLPVGVVGRRSHPVHRVGKVLLACVFTQSVTYRWPHPNHWHASQRVSIYWAFKLDCTLGPY